MRHLQVLEQSPSQQIPVAAVVVVEVAVEFGKIIEKEGGILISVTTGIGEIPEEAHRIVATEAAIESGQNETGEIEMARSFEVGDHRLREAHFREDAAAAEVTGMHVDMVEDTMNVTDSGLAAVRHHQAGERPWPHLLHKHQRCLHMGLSSVTIHLQRLMLLMAQNL
jgi:hypothetical protein